MPSIDEMSLEEVDRTIAQLRERRRELKQTGKAAERRIATLARRRQRLMDRVSELDEQIAALQREVNLEPAAPRRRGRKPKSIQISAS